MLKSYEELRKVDVKPFCEERDGALYLNWAKCVDLLHEYGAKKVYWLPIPDEKTGTSLRMADVTFKDSKGKCPTLLMEQWQKQKSMVSRL